MALYAACGGAGTVPLLLRIAVEPAIVLADAGPAAMRHSRTDASPAFTINPGQPDREPVTVKERWSPQVCSLEGHSEARMRTERSAGFPKQFKLQFQPGAPEAVPMQPEPSVSDQLA
jgi:hypothetical protein